MKRLFSKIFTYILISSFLFISFNITNASTYDDEIISNLELYSPSSEYNPEIDLNISEDVLGIGKIKILPDNTFYFLTDIKNWFYSTFALNKDAQIESLYKASSEKLKELEKCISLSEENCIKKGQESYINAKNDIYSKINKYQKDSKNTYIESLTSLEINHYILLSQLDSKYTSNIIENDLQNYSNFIKSLSDNTIYKKSVKLAIENDKNKSKLKNILINGYFESFENYLTIEKRAILSQIINENYETLIKNINQLNINNIEPTLQYYFYKISDTQKIAKQISIIDKLYELQDKVAETPNKENIKIAILNTKQIPISIFNQEIEDFSIEESEKKLSSIFKTGEIEQLNLIELLNKYNNGKKTIKTYQLLEIKDNNIAVICQRIKNISDSVQKEKLIESLLNSISPENKNLKKELLDAIEEKDSNVNTKIIISRLKERQNLIIDNEDEEETEENTLLSCPYYFDPICGEDEKTYNNKCLAKKEGVDILYKGECKILENTKLKDITEKELSQGWYSGNKSQKKPGTPATWVNIDSDTKQAKWIDPKKITNLKGVLNTDNE